MRKTLSLLFIVAALSFAAPLITVLPSIGPSGLATSALSYEANALQALDQGLISNISFGGDAAAYNRLIGQALTNQIIETTSFNSWLGIANPASPFQNEFGNNLYFGLSIIGGPASFSLSQLVYSDNFGDYEPSLAGSTPFSFLGVNYDDRFVAYNDDGVIAGVLDAGDTMVALNTDGTRNVNYLFYRGVSGFFLPLAGGTNQEALNNTVGALNGRLPVQLTATYCLAETPGSTTCGAAAGSASVSLSDIPEPSTYALMGLSLAALAYARRRA